MGVKCPIKYYYVTKVDAGKRRKLTWCELLENFKEVLEYVLPKRLVVESPTLLEKPVRDNNVENQKIKLLDKLKEGRLQLVIKKQRASLAAYIDQPLLLVGKKIQHKVREEGHDETFWCKGNVLDVCSINENNIKKSLYFVQYDGEEEKWEFPLLVDLEKGDLIIIS